MTAVAAAYGRSKGSAREFAGEYFGALASLTGQLDLDAIADVIEQLDRARQEGRMIFVIGNGGSAATASHIANDLLNLTYKTGATPPFRIVALTDNMAVFSAIANDDGYEQVFVRQLAPLFQRGDVLVSITASGNSPNILAAARWVRSHGGTHIGFLGFDGGAALAECDAAVVVRTVKGDYGLVEDVHMILDHVITSWFQQHLTHTGATS